MSHLITIPKATWKTIGKDNGYLPAKVEDTGELVHICIKRTTLPLLEEDLKASLESEDYERADYVHTVKDHFIAQTQ